jgi:hypothetical protein
MLGSDASPIANGVDPTVTSIFHGVGGGAGFRTLGLDDVPTAGALSGRAKGEAVAVIIRMKDSVKK